VALRRALPIQPGAKPRELLDLLAAFGQDRPQYEIASDKTDHVAAHKGSALTKID